MIQPDGQARKARTEYSYVCVWCSWSRVFFCEFSQIFKMSKTGNEEKYHFSRFKDWPVLRLSSPDESSLTGEFGAGAPSSCTQFYRPVHYRRRRGLGNKLATSLPFLDKTAEYLTHNRPVLGAGFGRHNACLRKVK
jgi:hypothetical protein